MSATRQEFVNEWANQILQSRTVAAVPTLGNGNAPERNANKQAGMLRERAKMAARAYAKRAGVGPPSDIEELRFAQDIASAITDAAREQLAIDENTERLLSGGTA
jgi:hypothetical protein